MQFTNEKAMTLAPKTDLSGRKRLVVQTNRDGVW